MAHAYLLNDLNHIGGDIVTAVIEKRVNLLALHGTEFSVAGNSRDVAPVDITESPSTFIHKSMSGELSCVGIGPRWRTDLESVTSLLSSIPSGAVALIPEADAEVAHLLGLAGFGKVIEFSPRSGIDWKYVLATLDQTGSSVAPEANKIRKSAEPDTARKTIVFSDPKSKAMLALIQRVAQVEVTTLLSGPSGVGKEVIAKLLHGGSSRAAGPFIPLNCSAIPEQLVESILFGHTKGSFTGASTDQPGVFESANGGTLFLDEVGELPLHIQPKLLRVIQERKAARIGSSKETSFDVRLVAATNRDLSAMVANGEFREDLFYRLNAFHIGIPRLSERPLDIKELAIKLAHSQQMAGVRMEISEAAINLLLQHGWPGNVRELENVICRAKVLAVNGVIDEEHILFDAMQFSQVADSTETDLCDEVKDDRRVNFTSNGSSDSKDLSRAKENTELELIESAMRETKSKKEAAERLGISPRTLRHKLQRLKEANRLEPSQDFQPAEAL